MCRGSYPISSLRSWASVVRRSVCSGAWTTMSLISCRTPSRQRSRARVPLYCILRLHWRSQPPIPLRPNVPPRHRSLVASSPQSEPIRVRGVADAALNMMSSISDVSATTTSVCATLCRFAPDIQLVRSSAHQHADARSVLLRRDIMSRGQPWTSCRAVSQWLHAGCMPPLSLALCHIVPLPRSLPSIDLRVHHQSK